LFAPTESVNDRGKCTVLGGFVQTPFRNYKKIHVKLKEHLSNKYHGFAQERADMFIKSIRSGDTNVINQVDQHWKRQAEEIRQQLVPIVKTIILCGRLGIALRDHRDDGIIDIDTALSGREGNFRALLAFRVNSGDKALVEYLTNARKKVTYVSKETQNELIQICVIISDIKKAKYFSIIRDETTDSSDKEEFCLCIRYVSEDLMLKFGAIEDLCARSIVSEILERLQKLDLCVADCVGQGYDGALALAGHISGVQVLFRQHAPMAVYVHCASHTLYLVLNHESNLTAIRNMFGVLADIIKLIENSPKQKYIFEEEQKSFDKKSRPCSLQSSSQTRWGAPVDAISVIQKTYSPLVKTLERIISEDTDGARDQLADMKSFWFLLITDVLHDILQLMHMLLACLQALQLELVAAKELVILTENKLSAIRDESKFKEYFKTASKRVDELKIPVTFTAPSSKNTRRGELVEMTPEVYFRTQFYYPVLAFWKCGRLYNSLSKVLQKIQKKPDTLTKAYGSGDQNDIDPTALLTEYRVFCDYYFKIGSKVEDNLTDVVKLLTKQGLESSFPSVTVMYKIAITLPVTSAGAECTFSKLKLIKTRLCSTVRDKRLENLIIISVERNFLDPIDVSDIIDKFAEQRNRRIRLR
uniref:HAT C-terminal dimerisation domain-containing protein n=1 Tax=Latimeria chalumnae TaxID=7897 RepID=H3AL73_LATCH